MDVVLGVSMAPSTVRMILVEGQNAGGLTVDHDAFDVAGGAASRVLAAILGTREAAREGGYQLSSMGVTFSDPAEAAALRDALVGHKVENVMLVSAFLAAAALAQAVGSATHYTRTGLLFVEPDTATLAVVDCIDGSIAEIQRRALPGDDDRAVAEIAALAAGAHGLASRPGGLFVVGSGGVDVAMIKPALEQAGPLPVTVPADPDLALAQGAALASAHAPLFSSSTRAVAWARDPGTGMLDPALISVGYAYVPDVSDDYRADPHAQPLAYSAVPDLDSRMLDFSAIAEPHGGRRPTLLTGGVAALFVVGVLTLVIALAVTMRSTNDHRPDVRAHVVTHEVHPPAAVPSPPPAAPPPVPEPAAPPPVPVAAPAPAPAAPAPVPEAPAPMAPAPAPAAPPPPPPLFPNLEIPGLPGGPPLFGPPKGGWGGWGDWGGHDGHGGDDNHGGWGNWGGDDDRGRGGGHGGGWGNWGGGDHGGDHGGGHGH